MNDKKLIFTGNILIILMCLIRFGIAIVAYIKPELLMTELGFPLETNKQGPYLGRVWAIRDIVLSILVIYFLFTNKKVLITIIIACIAIDLTDIMSAHLGYIQGIFNSIDAWDLKLTAILALIPETIALLIFIYLEKKINLE